MSLEPHSPAWYDRLATLQTGYHYPWQSTLGAHNGEDVFLALVQQHCRPEADVLEAACGHGELALWIAPQVRSVLAYDRTAAWIELARHATQAQARPNVRFLIHDSSPGANGGRARLPADDRSMDLLICSKGPFHWILDARRVARPGATLLMLVPDARPHPAWHADLPPMLQWPEGGGPSWAQRAIGERLAAGGLDLDSWWSFDVPEHVPSPEQLYVMLTWGDASTEVPTFEAVRPALERIFREHADDAGLTVRHRRHIWQAVVPR